MYKKKVADLVALALSQKGIDDIDTEALIEIPPNPEMGDFALPCFSLAKRLRRAPAVIAADLAKEMADVDWLGKVETVGGYLNFTIRPAKYAEDIVASALRAGAAYGSDSRQGIVVIDFSSPNIAKPFSVAHIRSTVIGNSLSRIYSHLGYEVVRVNHLGDWGTQFGKLIVAYHKWGDDEAIKANPIKELHRIYVKYHQEAENDPSMDDRAREWFKRLEDGDEEARRLWTWFRDESIKEFKRVYDRMGIEFDSYTGESFYNDKMEDAFQRIAAKGLVSESEGALVVDLGETMPPCLLKKRDGATLYATRDIAAAIYRWETYHFTKLLYVVGVTQSLHFKQVFTVLEKMGYDWVRRCEHIPFGTILFGDQVMSSRKGNVIYLEDILDEAVRRVDRIIEERNPGLANRAAVAEQVGVGAVIFNELARNRIKDVEFEWDKVLTLDGDTGLYVQYAHARARSVLRKAGERDWQAFNAERLTDDKAMAVVRLIERFPAAVSDAADSNEPSTVARYCLDLSSAFNLFYHENRILGVDPETEAARLAITKAVADILATGLQLLGLQAPEEI